MNGKTQLEAGHLECCFCEQTSAVTSRGKVELGHHKNLSERTEGLRPVTHLFKDWWTLSLQFCRIHCRPRLCAFATQNKISV